MNITDYELMAKLCRLLSGTEQKGRTRIRPFPLASSNWMRSCGHMEAMMLLWFSLDCDALLIHFRNYFFLCSPLGCSNNSNNNNRSPFIGQSANNWTGRLILIYCAMADCCGGSKWKSQSIHRSNDQQINHKNKQMMLQKSELLLLIPNRYFQIACRTMQWKDGNEKRENIQNFCAWRLKELQLIFHCK